MLAACASNGSNESTSSSHMIERRIIETYNPIPDGKYAKFYDWGRDHARMYLDLGRCQNKNVLQGRFMERVRVSSMVLGKEQYNQVMFALRDQAQQMQGFMSRLDNDMFFEYYGPLSDDVCHELEQSSNYMVFDTLDYGIKWRESINNPVNIEDWEVYPVFANSLGNVVFDEKGIVKRDATGHVVLK